MGVTFHLQSILPNLFPLETFKWIPSVFIHTKPINSPSWKPKAIVLIWLKCKSTLQKCNFVASIFFLRNIYSANEIELKTFSKIKSMIYKYKSEKSQKRIRKYSMKFPILHCYLNSIRGTLEILSNSEQSFFPMLFFISFINKPRKLFHWLNWKLNVPIFQQNKLSHHRLKIAYKKCCKIIIITIIVMLMKTGKMLSASLWKTYCWVSYLFIYWILMVIVYTIYSTPYVYVSVCLGVQYSVYFHIMYQ